MAGRKNLAKRIDKLVDTRNDIVHSGHINSHGNPKAIDRGDIGSRMSELKLFVETSEQLINDWVKSKNLSRLTSTTE